MQECLETLAITLETTDDESELEWLLDMVTSPKESLCHLTNLKHLVLPQVFLFNAESSTWPSKSCQPKDLPPKLETLEILYPQEEVEEWVAGFVPRRTDQCKTHSTFRKITLKCRDEVGTPASYFSTEVDRIWWELTTNQGIDTYTICQIQESSSNLAELWYAESLLKTHSEGGQDEPGGKWRDDTNSDVADDDDEPLDPVDLLETPDLVDPMD
jgi:hypothetical protein